MRYTKEVLALAVENSFSVADVTRHLGLKNPNGGTHAHISRRIKHFNLNTNHFLGQFRGIGLNALHLKLDWQIILVNHRIGVKEHTPILRRAMIESGIKHECGSCGSQPEWNGKSLVLQISHKDGDSLNNERKNLHFECPNCHSQTDDYGGRGAGKSFRGSIVQ
jgi:hypothetical protein